MVSSSKSVLSALKICDVVFLPSSVILARSSGYLTATSTSVLAASPCTSVLWRQLLLLLLLNFKFWVHEQKVQVSYIAIHVPQWFAASTTLLSMLGISPNAVPPLASHPPTGPRV